MLFKLGRGYTHTHACALGVTRSSGAIRWTINLKVVTMAVALFSEH